MQSAETSATAPIKLRSSIRFLLYDDASGTWLGASGFRAGFFVVVVSRIYHGVMAGATDA